MLAKTQKYLLLITYNLSLITFLCGCATAPYGPPMIQRPQVPGIYHRVLKGQTLWRIAKFYDVSINDIVKANRIPDATQISAGQLLFIPNTTAPRPIEISASAETFEKSDFIWPARGKIIFFYGSKKDGMLNKGVDIFLREGTDIAASRAGKVVFFDPKLKGYGQTIIIDHFDGFSTLYAHNSAVLVKTGDHVKQAQVIAKAGSSGRTSGPCLHFQIRKGDKPQNPFYYLPR